MSEYSSETIARKKARQQTIGKWLKFMVPTVLVISIVLVAFFDSRAVVMGFSVIVVMALGFIFTVGSGGKKRKTVIKDYNVRTIRPGSEESVSESAANPYTTAEGYHDLVEAYHNQQVVAGSKAGSDSNNQNQKQQSQLGAEISNSAMVAIIVAAMIVLWLFA